MTLDNLIGISLEQMDVYQSDEVQDSFDGVKPSINGFYAIKKEPPFLSVPTHGVAMVAVVSGAIFLEDCV
ncbi:MULTISPECIES: hypothetical protein [Legionellaceae]|uniref:hypothetical protein n=1 Tax=Legionellaceae TaxID=444 RepID=UPI000413F629|nr:MULTISPECIES: hypothetical protein [Legionellaceae]MDW8925924.1 hypothetical protein [Legionella pneumophila]KTD12316.1 hypothetical protein Lhac_1187 [Legionella hackeliae]MCW8397111.1 hypothetical protein [Legionella sp. PATHC039]MDW8932026.1 hypothetical protein [Legionella pneumophila]MDW8972471.1 hypothetical protein [Legionella pneumophila]